MMTFHPVSPADRDGYTAVEVWERDRQVATIYAMESGLNVITTPDYEPSDVDMQTRAPMGVQFRLSPRSEREGKRR
jgi:hypothetical protein